MNRKITAALLITAAVLTNLAFTALGTVFDYPDVLKEPTGDILASFGRLSRRTAMRRAVPVGVAAAVVQVVGLARWPLLVPGYAADAASSDPVVAAAAQDSFHTAHRLLGTVIGETGGYLLTAAWTLLVLVALGRTFAGRWFTVLGALSAVLIAAGVLSPLNLALVDTANFIGYVLWSVWLVAFAVLLLVRRDTAAIAPTRRPVAARL